MEQEKKKRVRATWKMIRALEEKNTVLEETVKRLSSFSDIESAIRDNAIYRQAMINFSSMIRGRKEPAILLQGSKECDDFCSMVYDDIRKHWDDDVTSLKKKVKELKADLRRLSDILKSKREYIVTQSEVISNLENELHHERHRGFWSRVFNKHPR